MLSLYLGLLEEGMTYQQISESTGKSVSSIRSTIYRSTHSHVRRERRARLDTLHKAKARVGLRCFVCEYDRCSNALELHHRDPKLKKFKISDAIYNKIKATQEEIDAELDKCVLLCANCHREVHAGMIDLAAVKTPAELRIVQEY